MSLLINTNKGQVTIETIWGANTLAIRAIQDGKVIGYEMISDIRKTLEFKESTEST